MLFLQQIWVQRQRYSVPLEPPVYAKTNSDAYRMWELKAHSERWRDERNMWLSFCTALLYVVTNRIYSLRAELVSLRLALETSAKRQ
jgi:hypothetical protein